MRYIPNSPSDRRLMLQETGIGSVEELFAGIPEKLRLRRLLDIPRALTEPELIEYFRERASRNTTEHASFVGAGIYRHHIPIIIDAIVSRGSSSQHTPRIRLRSHRARYRRFSSFRPS